ncbi:phosphoribosylaminoimidazolesuccinocarboxamide synthase [Phocicoccus pinnipedialis]|uniref:Phosphoribosylaminoimidazole-succinocarboxamide synthase n=1 Tax=Phocicoccus pinnipedialis TaxID=110845 RepID=A0A6V7R8K6_9BACL|nr:phosphoribosylaminoimidazolesuccinocarboxamide synthase [Jeotgalicoccus pinnipedialis]MBP1938843.1 phosphoribosylaminoimidazole-succinocarboxamide synthase [Jeotgalicoccus pinnipedialis]CAD2073328.1 Phosphoribosylaminoimidazole-succinocarboxamide synthase [Jeotgalicoccus pinnipedialis]
MEQIYKGKTKDVYRDSNGDIVLFFKDDMTGKDGVFDPGENQVGLTVKGSGLAGLKMTTYFFELLNDLDIPTHFISSNFDKNEMRVREVTTFGDGLEVICRYVATGSYYRRYGKYIEDGTVLENPIVEFTLKDDERQDPVASKETLNALDLLHADEYDTIAALTVRICDVVKEKLTEKGLDLYDIKLEFGRDHETNEILLIDEISGGNMRVFKGEENIHPLEIGTYLL